MAKTWPVQRKFGLWEKVVGFNMQGLKVPFAKEAVKCHRGGVLEQGLN